MRKKTGIAIAGGVTLVVAAFLTAVVCRPDPYAFLDKFHPTRSENPPVKAWVSVRGGSGPPAYNSYTLVFRAEDAEAVRAALEADLVGRRRFEKSYWLSDESYSLLAKPGGWATERVEVFEDVRMVVPPHGRTMDQPQLGLRILREQIWNDDAVRSLKGFLRL